MRRITILIVAVIAVMPMVSLQTITALNNQRLPPTVIHIQLGLIAIEFTAAMLIGWYVGASDKNAISHRLAVIVTFCGASLASVLRYPALAGLLWMVSVLTNLWKDFEPSTPELLLLMLCVETSIGFVITTVGATVVRKMNKQVQPA